MGLVCDPKTHRRRNHKITSTVCLVGGGEGGGEKTGGVGGVCNSVNNFKKLKAGVYAAQKPPGHARSPRLARLPEKNRFGFGEFPPHSPQPASSGTPQACTSSPPQGPGAGGK